MSKRIKKAPTAIEAQSSNYSSSKNSYTNKHILKKFDENVKYQYEIIDLIETAKEASLSQLLCMIQEAKEELGKSNVVEKLYSILNERFKYV